MSDSVNSTSPSSLGAFVRGFGSGALNGGLMMGILFAVTKAASLITILGVTAPAAGAFLATAGIATLATGLFSGVMAAKEAALDTPSAITTVSHEHTPSREAIIPVPVLGMSSPALMSDTPPSKNWVAQTGRTEDAQTRVQQILSNGSLSDKDRASAILAARETSVNSPSTPAI